MLYYQHQHKLDDVMESKYYTLPENKQKIKINKKYYPNNIKRTFRTSRTLQWNFSTCKFCKFTDAQNNTALVKNTTQNKGQSTEFTRRKQVRRIHRQFRKLLSKDAFNDTGKGSKDLFTAIPNSTLFSQFSRHFSDPGSTWPKLFAFCFAKIGERRHPPVSKFPPTAQHKLNVVLAICVISIRVG